MVRLLIQALGNAKGASSIEYALIAGFLSIVIVTAVSNLGSEVVSLFQSVKDAF